MAPNHEEAVLVVAPRLSRWRMLNLMGSVKKGKHVGIWGITSHRVRRINLRPVDPAGAPSDIPLPLPTYIQADGEPILQLPATLTWHPAQITTRGAKTVPWDSE
jgi:diacylglycerol kinase family enzyme